MLRLPSVTDFATVERLDIELGAGFSVLTGETGAGKSIIVDALGLLLGGRADVGMVRPGARQTRVEGIFLPCGDISQKINAALYAGRLQSDCNSLRGNQPSLPRSLSRT